MAEMAEDRRTSERRAAAGRRAEDLRRSRVQTAYAAAWAIAGAIVVLFLFFVVLDALDPDDAPAVSIVVLVLAVAWLVHAWRRLLAPSGHVSRPDRERRGF